MRELSKHVLGIKRGRERWGGRARGKASQLTTPQQCVRTETTRHPVCTTCCQQSPATTAVLWQSSFPSLPLPPSPLPSHACVLYTRMLFHLRKCFFSELCPDELVRRWIGSAVFQSNALANVEHRSTYPTHTHTYICAHISHTLHSSSFPYPLPASCLICPHRTYQRDFWIFLLRFYWVLVA